MDKAVKISTFKATALLQKISDDCMGPSVLPVDLKAAETWRGFVLPVADLHLVTQLNSNVELTQCPKIFPVPMVKPWLLGVVANRGEIYTVVDFSRFLGYTPISKPEDAFLFILGDSVLKCALLLKERVTLRTFESDFKQLDDSIMNATVSPYLTSVLFEDGIYWGVLDLDRLCADPSFIRAGI